MVVLIYILEGGGGQGEGREVRPRQHPDVDPHDLRRGDRYCRRGIRRHQKA